MCVCPIHILCCVWYWQDGFTQPEDGEQLEGEEVGGEEVGEGDLELVEGEDDLQLQDEYQYDDEQEEFWMRMGWGLNKLASMQMVTTLYLFL